MRCLQSCWGCLSSKLLWWCPGGIGQQVAVELVAALAGRCQQQAAEDGTVAAAAAASTAGNAATTWGAWGRWVRPSQRTLCLHTGGCRRVKRQLCWRSTQPCLGGRGQGEEAHHQAPEYIQVQLPAAGADGHADGGADWVYANLEEEGAEGARERRCCAPAKRPPVSC